MKILALEFSSAQRSVAVLHSDFRRDESRGSSSPPISETSGTRGARPAEYQVREVVETGPGALRALAMIDEVLREAALEREHIERLVVGIGPGSYTGVRAAIAMAQGWQLARAVKLQGISSVECLARQAQADGLTGRISIVIDAQRGEFYLARYEIHRGDPDPQPEGRARRVLDAADKTETRGACLSGTGAATSCREVEPLRLATRAEVGEREQAGEVLVGPEITRWIPSGRVLFPSAAMLALVAAEREDFVPGEKLEPIYLRQAQFVKARPPKMLKK
jgi:tRNA threonylcarbamoyl adenosine modification protein YeaZ